MWHYKGFTLIELIVTLALVAILATLGVPSFLNSIESNRLRSAGEELYGRLYAARTKAINEQTPVYISFNTGTSWCFGLNSSGYCNCSVPSSCNIGTVTNTNNGISLSATNFANNQTQITAGRGMFQNAGNVVFSLKAKNLTVATATMGRIRICSSTVAGYKSC